MKISKKGLSKGVLSFVMYLYMSIKYFTNKIDAEKTRDLIDIRKIMEYNDHVVTS